MTYSEFVELTGFPFINSDLYHDEAEKAYCNFAGNKEEFCKTFQLLSDDAVLLDGFLSSLIWGHEGINSDITEYRIFGSTESADYTMQYLKVFYTKTAAIFKKFECTNEYPDFRFRIR